MEQPKRKKQRTLTEMYPKPGDSNNNRNPQPKDAIDPPVPFHMFKKMVQNLPAIVSKYNQNKVTSSLDTGEQFYRDFYSNPEVRKLYPLNIKPCPSYLRNKLLQIPDESKQHPNDEEFVRPTNSSIKRKRKKQRSKKTYIYPVTFETFKEYLDHEALMTDLLWRVSKKNEEEYNRIKNDEECYERTLRLYYNTFYLQPERRNEYNYMFKETSPEMLQKLLSHAVLQDDKNTSKTDNKKDREKFEKSEIILEKTNSIDDKLIRREHKINSSFTSEYLDRESREWLTDEMFSKASNYDVFIEQAELINERLMFPITESKLKNFLVNFDEIYSEIARRNPFVTAEISTIVFHEFYRLFYLFPEFRSFYNCRYKVCPLRVKQNILESPTNLDYSGILFPITISTFKEFVNYEEVLDKLIKTVVAKDEKEFSIAKNDEKLCQRIFEAYYYSYYLSPHIVRVLFSHKSKVADENIKSKLFDMPILRPANDGDATCTDLSAVENNNPISQTQNEHNAQDTTCKRRRSDFDFPVSVRIFKEYINYNYVMDAVVKNYVKNDESKFMKLRQDTNFCKKQLDIFYNNFYLNKNFRKKYQVTFKNAPPELQDKLWKFAITKKKPLTDVIEILDDIEKNVEETTVSNLCDQESVHKKASEVQIISVVTLKPSPEVELAERIYFQSVSIHHNIEYLIYTSSELNQCIWETVNGITYEDFQSITGIYNATELYDNFRLRRFYRYVAEQKNWPVNLYIKMKYFVSYFQSKDVPLFELDLKFISPKLFYWHELLKYTNFKDCVYYDYLKHNNKPLLNDSDFIAECERYYNRCWTHNKWISQTPHVTDLNLKTQLTKRKKSIAEYTVVDFPTFQSESDIENSRSNSSQINEQILDSQSSTSPSQINELLSDVNNSGPQGYDYNILEAAVSNPLTENFVDVKNITTLQSQDNFQENENYPHQNIITNNMVSECSAFAETDLIEPECTSNDCSESNPLMIEPINSENVIIIDDDSTENNTNL